MTTITPAKVRNIILGAKEAGREVVSIEVDGFVVNLLDEKVQEDNPSKGHGKRKWSAK